MTTARARVSVEKGWKYRLVSANGNKTAEGLKDKLDKWMPVTTFPSVVQMELLAAGLMPDPNLGQNERLVQWVGEADWEYSASFQSPSTVSEHAELVFEGLDTIATATLNGTEILKSDNMFLPTRVDVKHLLREGGKHNELVILFESPIKVGAEREAKFGVLGPSIMRGTKRMQIRKAQVRAYVIGSLVCRELTRPTCSTTGAGIGDPSC